MAKNIVHLHERVKFWLDITRTPRIKSKTIDSAINIAINDILKDRFKPSIQADSQQKNLELKGFQRTGILRDELRPLVKISEPITLSSSLLATADLPVDFGYHTLFKFTLNNGVNLFAIPTTQEKYDIIMRDPYQRLNNNEANRLYYIEKNEGFEFLYSSWGKARNGDNITSTLKVHYIARPVDVFLGYEKSLSAVASGESIVSQETSVVLGADVKLGDVIPYNAGNSANTTKVVTGSVNMSLPEILFDEVAKLAAQHLSNVVTRTSQVSQ